MGDEEIVYFTLYKITATSQPSAKWRGRKIIED
jgi:hypothetical protein